MSDIMNEFDLLSNEGPPEVNWKKFEIDEYLQNTKLEGFRGPKDIKFTVLNDGKIVNVPIDKLHVNKKFQRNLVKKNAMKIAKSMQKFGFLAEWPLLINEEYSVISGQHRYVAALQIGEMVCPCVIVKFEDEKAEARYFDFISSFQHTKLNMMERLKAKKEAGDEFVLFMCKLIDDENCLLYKQTRMPGINGSHKLFSPTVAFRFIAFAVNQRTNLMSWTDDTQHQIEKKMQNLPYHTIVKEINFVLDIYFKLYGYSKDEFTDTFYYNARFIMAFIVFIKKLLNEDTILLEANGVAELCKKMRKMVISNEERLLMNAPHALANRMIQFFKRKVRKNSKITELSGWESHPIEPKEPKENFIDLDKVLGIVSIPDFRICNGLSKKKREYAVTENIIMPHNGEPTKFPLKEKHFRLHKASPYGFLGQCRVCAQLSGKIGVSQSIEKSA